MISPKVSPRLARSLVEARLVEARQVDECEKIRRVVIWTAEKLPLKQPLSFSEKLYSVLEGAGFKASFFDLYNVKVRHALTLVNAFSAEIPPSSLLKLVKEVDEYREIVALDEAGVVHARLNATVPMVRGDAVWRDFGYTGRGVKIAIVDSGINSSHPDLKGKVLEYINVSTDSNESDLNGHGTHVAGIAAGAGEKYRGVAPEAYLLNAKAINYKGRGGGDDVAYAMEWSYHKGANIINMSIGTEDETMCRDIMATIARELVARGVVVVVAAGNSGPRSRSIESPGCSPFVITVGAVTKDGVLAEYSSRGPTQELLMKPDLVAPGGDWANRVIAPLSRELSPKSFERLKPYIVDDNYVGMYGTSMATPHVAGVAALILEAAKEMGVLTETENPHSLVKHVLMSTAKDLGYSKYEQGAGLVDARASIEYLKKLAEARKSVVDQRAVPVITSQPLSAAPPVSGEAQRAVESLIGGFLVEMLRGFGMVLGQSLSAALLEFGRRERSRELEKELSDLVSQLRTLEAMRNAGLIPEAEYMVWVERIKFRLAEIVRKLED
ncbi:MAG: S8 family serine peptidase [Thermofilaceae archaeon]